MATTKFQSTECLVGFYVYNLTSREGRNQTPMQLKINIIYTSTPIYVYVIYCESITL